MNAGAQSKPLPGIAPAREADAAALARLHDASFATGWDADALRAFVEDPSCVSLMAGGGGESEPLGFVIARVAADEAEILTLAVAARARCRGVGRTLLDALRPRLAGKGVRALFLEVDGENHAATALYRKCGFAQAGARPGYYRDRAHGGPRDALILKLDISTA